MITELQLLNLEMYRDRAYIMSLLCSESSSFFSLLKTVLNLPIIITSSIMSIMNSGLFESDQMKLPNIVLNSSTALILSLVNTFKLPERQANFKSSHIKFTKLLHKIEDSIVNDQDNLTTEELRAFINEYDAINENIEYGFPSHIKTKIKNTYYGKRTLPNILNCTTSFVKDMKNRRISMLNNDILSRTHSGNTSRALSSEFVNIEIKNDDGDGEG